LRGGWGRGEQEKSENRKCVHVGNLPAVEADGNEGRFGGPAAVGHQRRLIHLE
jgi:hypothetical protein